MGRGVWFCLLLDDKRTGEGRGGHTNLNELLRAGLACGLAVRGEEENTGRFWVGGDAFSVLGLLRRVEGVWSDGRSLALSNYVFTMLKHAEAIPIVIFYNSLPGGGAATADNGGGGGGRNPVGVAEPQNMGVEQK